MAEKRSQMIPADRLVLTCHDGHWSLLMRDGKLIGRIPLAERELRDEFQIEVELFAYSQEHAEADNVTSP